MHVWGWSPRTIALAAYAVTIALAAIAWLGLRNGLHGFLLVSGLSVAGLLTIAIRLGCLRSEQPAIPSRPLAGVAANRQPGGSL